MSCSNAKTVRCIPAVLGAVVLLLCVFQPVLGQSSENGDIVVLLADFQGPDPEGIPVTESLFSWIQQVGSEEGTFRVLRLNEVIEYTEESYITAFEIGLEAGVDLVVYGTYDLPGTRARIALSVISCSGSSAGSGKDFGFVSEYAFPLSELAPGSQPPEQLRFLSDYLAGSAYFSSGDLERGLEYVNKALLFEDSVPDNLLAAAYSLRSQINLQWFGDAVASLSDANRAIELDSENPDYYMFRGYIYEMMGEYQSAMEDLLTTGELVPSDPNVLYNLCLIYQRLGDYDSAIDAISEAMLLEPDSEIYLNARGFLYNNMGEYQGAVDDISRSLELNPEYPTGWANLGCAQRELGNFTDAIQCFSNAIEYQTDPVLITSYMLDRGDCSAVLLDYESAIDDYTYVLNLYPGTASQYSYLGWMLIQIEDFENAVTYCNMALQIDSISFNDLCNRGLCYYRIGETAAAVDDLTAAMELDPDGFSTNDYFALGRAYREEGDFVSAINTFSLALDEETDLIYRSWMLSDRAKCYHLAGDLESALADLDEAIQLQPSDPELHNQRGEICYLMNMDDEAVESFNNAIEMGLTGDYLSGCLFQKGRIHLDGENYGMAIQDLTAALEIDPHFFEVYYFRGMAHYHNGSLDMCREDMEHFLQVSIDSEYTASARAILRYME